MNIKSFESIVIHKWIRLLLDTGQSRGISHSQLLAGTCLSEYSRDNLPPLISSHTMFKVERNLVHYISDPVIGLVLGANLNVAWYGLIGFATMSCETLASGFDVWRRYVSLNKVPFELSLEIEGEIAQLKLDDTQHLDELIALECSIELASHYTIIRNITGEAFRCRQIQLSFSPPNPKQYEEFFDCPLVVTNSNAIVFDRCWLDFALPLADHDTKSILLDLCDDVVLSAREDTLVQQIRDLLSRGPDPMPTMGEVAGALGMSSRTLRRRLTQLDSSYSEIASRVKQSLALEHVTDSDLSIEEVATRVGYADAANFRQAFKAWTGETPLGYRRHYRQSMHW